MKNNNLNYKNYDKALKSQKERYLKRVKKMMQKDLYMCYFLTFTFTNRMLEETSEQTRLRYIKEWLNQQASEYLLNKDYGDKNGREHYHAFILSRYKVIVIDTPLRHNVFIKAKKITATLSNNFKTNIVDERKNITTDENITAHAFKETTKNSKIIYSRQNDKIDSNFKSLADAKLKAYRESPKGKINKQLFNDLLNQEMELYKEHLKESEELDKYFGIY